MKKSKRFAALIAAVLMAVTMFSSAVPTFAAAATGSFKCNGYVISCMGTSSNSDKNADASTFCALHDCKYLYAYVLGNQQDKDGYNTQYIGKASDTTDSKNPRHSGTAKIKVTSNSYQFVKIVSTHLARDGSDEQAKVLQVK